MTKPLPPDKRPGANVVIVGPFSHATFAPLLQDVTSLAGDDQIRAHGSIRSLLSHNRESDSSDQVDLLIVLQAWPDQYPHSEILDLLDRFPLTRLMVCYGPWCDSDGRTRHLWPAAVRVPIAQASSRVSLELAVTSPPAEPLPLTASRDETYFRDFSWESSEKRRDLSIAINTPDPAVRSWLTAWICDQNWTVRQVADTSAELDLLIWDVDPWSPATADQIVTCRRQRPQVPIVGMVGFARDHEVDQMHECGIAAVLTKTGPANELRRVVEALIGISDASPVPDLPSEANSVSS